MRKSVVSLPSIYNLSDSDIEKGKKREKMQEKKKEEQTQIQNQNNNERENSLNTLLVVLVRQAAMTLNSFDVECHFSAFLSK